jgi:hypothetical protein
MTVSKRPTTPKTAPPDEAHHPNSSIAPSPLSSFFQNDCRAAGRREGLRRFSMRPPLGSACQVTDQKLHARGTHSLSEDASVP